jgi:phosphatidylglycerol:prolipoprotein diacylglycerol transferase
MHPILFEIGPLQIRFYGLMYAIAITCGLYIIRREVRRQQISLSNDDVLNFVMLSVVGGIIGARLYYVIFNWSNYRHELWEIIKIWHGGLAIHGGVIGGTLAGWWFTRWHRVSFWKMADIVAPALILGQTFGRFGNFMNGDAHGIPTTMPWGIVFPPTSIAGYQFPGIPLHPTMLYEMVINFCIFLFLWKIRTRPWKGGLIFCLYCILYSIGRFFVSGFRADSLLDPLWGFRVARIISIVIIVLAGTLIIKKRLWERGDNAD